MSKTKSQPSDNTLSTPLNEVCAYCGRVRWGSYQYLFRGAWRHSECYPGSRDWQEYYERLPETKRTSEMKAIYKHFKKG